MQVEKINVYEQKEDNLIEIYNEDIAEIVMNFDKNKIDKESENNIKK